MALITGWRRQGGPAGAGRPGSTGTPGGAGGLTGAGAPGSAGAGTGAPPGGARPTGRLRRLFGRGPVGRLRTQTAVAVLLVVGLLAAALLSFAAARDRLDHLQHVSEPRAATAADLYQQLADLDAQHAQALVVGYDTTPAAAAAAGRTPVLVDDGELAALTAQADRARISADLTALARSADPAQVGALLDQISRYDQLTGVEGELMDRAGGTEVAGSTPGDSVDAFAEAEAVLSEQVLPQVRTVLAQADAQVTGDRHAAEHAAARAELLVGVVGLAGLAVLVWWQRDLARRYQRLLSPPLLAATAAVLAVLLAAGLALFGAAGEVRTAVGRGYQPYATLSQVQVAGADAEAAENRWLVDRGYRPQLAAEFQAQSGTVRRLLAGQPDAAPVRARFDAWGTADARLRQLADGGDTVDAAVQLTGVTRGQVAFASYDFFTSLDQLAAQRLAVFTAHADRATSALAGWDVIPAAVLAPALLLIATGVRPRLAEFG